MMKSDFGDISRQLLFIKLNSDFLAAHQHFNEERWDSFHLVDSVRNAVQRWRQQKPHADLAGHQISACFCRSRCTLSIHPTPLISRSSCRTASNKNNLVSLPSAEITVWAYQMKAGKCFFPPHFSQRCGRWPAIHWRGFCCAPRPRPGSGSGPRPALCAVRTWAVPRKPNDRCEAGGKLERDQSWFCRTFPKRLALRV